PLPSPFFVLATQNPIEQEGTYPLPEAQLDRFMFNIWVNYPTLQEEIDIVKSTTDDRKVQINAVITQEEILNYQNIIRKMPVADNVIEYAVKLVNKTRPDGEITPDWVNKNIAWGAGPRASQHLIIGAKCHAAIMGKYSPDVEDVQAVAEAILRHRIVRNYKAEAEGISATAIIKGLF
ncbi:MAG: MoxR family ATPase, partial [Sphingobacteriales bacterium]